MSVRPSVGVLAAVHRGDARRNPLPGRDVDDIGRTRYLPGVDALAALGARTRLYGQHSALSEPKGTGVPRSDLGLNVDAEVIAVDGLVEFWSL